MTTVDPSAMNRALQLARQGEGRVEPNPMVGCVIVAEGTIVGEGFHQQFGGPHAEINALDAAGNKARGATMYVTLEPCCHQGKTPPCTEAIIRAGLAQVVIAHADPFPSVSGGGIQKLQSAGIEVVCGVGEQQAGVLLAPYLKLLRTGRPWVIAKWAMTRDGMIARANGESKWISCESSRRIVHQIRGRMDGILVGRRTAELDDPWLTARPAGPRVATRIVLDSSASLSLKSQLVQTAATVPVLVAVAQDADRARIAALEKAGCQIVHCSGDSHAERLAAMLDELGKQPVTNILVEGGAAVLNTLLDIHEVDEAHIFFGAKSFGEQGIAAPRISPSSVLATNENPLDMLDIRNYANLLGIENIVVETVDEDTYLHGRMKNS